MIRNKIPLLSAIAVFVVSITCVWSQIRTRVEEVVVPVNVRDGDGKMVTGLTREDFVVTEDGQPQSISNFSADPMPLSAAIVVDDGMGGNALRRLSPLFVAVTAGFTPDDEMAAFRYDHFVWKLADFTHDQATIQKSFDVIAKIAETRPAQGEPGDMAVGPSWLRSIANLFSIGSNGPPKTVPSAADRPTPAPTSRVLHDAIYDAAVALRDRPKDRRKIIFIISDGQVSGRNAHSLEQNIDLLLKNEIQVYGVSAEFALVEGPLSVLNSYARATGGDVYGGGSTNSMETAFSRITEQARNQYVLHYASSNRPGGPMGVFRTIDVRTRLPNQRVTHRKGYIQLP
jgi:VWFA-related protein